MQKDKKTYIKNRDEVSTVLARVKYALENNSVDINIIYDRLSEEQKDIRHTNRYTLNDLFPDDDHVSVLKQELGKLSLSDYMESVVDDRLPNKSLDVFGKSYKNQDVYIKFRVELFEMQRTHGKDLIVIVSFHYSDRVFNKSDFPYKF
ncbi:MAG: hypothetical protein JXB20_05785 [Bacilli bacterium]|nr:hypothetical protein [Bacilli bacterium]